MRHNILKKLSVLTLAGLALSCDFEEKNIDPNNSTTIDPGPLLTYIELSTTDGGIGKNVQVGTCMMLVQQASSLNKEDMPGDKYYNSEVNGTAFNSYYSSIIKNQKELIVHIQDNEKYINTFAVAKIFGAYMFNRITDLYGDVPYSEAGNGYYEQIYYPVYDHQETIYTDMINEVQSALALFDPEKPAIQGDLIYDGDIAKWKKFGNSLLLRLGMRLSKVKPDLAKEIVQKAVQGGIMNDASDIAMIKHISGQDRTENPLSNRFITDNFVEHGTIKISKTFMDHLKSTNDPRIKVYCSLPDGNANPSDQRGLPNGYDLTNIPSVETDYTNLNVYSNFNVNTILKRTAPTIFMAASESNLLIAEAIVRGWVSGNATDYYQAAVRLSMKEQAVYGEEGTISDTEIESFLINNLFTKAKTTEEQLEVIGKEFWVATFMNGFESYANWRRLGYPVLKPTNYSGSTNPGRISRRLTYPTKEYAINKKNIEQAVQHQGPDDLNTRLWWDKQ